MVKSPGGLSKGSKKPTPPSVAHDLNQPLTALILYLQAALMAAEKSGQPLPDNVRGLIEKALREAERAGALIRGIAPAAPEDAPL